MLLSLESFFWIGFLVFVWLTVISIFLFRVIRSIKKFQVGKKEIDIATLLEEITKNQKNFSTEVVAIKEKVENLEVAGSLHIQKIGLIRFNPFSDTGGDQSFALALLDEHNTGLIISSLHSRDNTRVYAKPVKKGEPLGYDFSKEEKEAVGKACKQ